jgi:hypothetical protein
MFRLFIDNKKRLGVNFTKFFRRSQATLVSYAASVKQTFNVGMFSDSFTAQHYCIQVFHGILNALIARVKNTSQSVAIEYLPPFFCLPFLFFNTEFRNEFTTYLHNASDNRYSL